MAAVRVLLPYPRRGSDPISYPIPAKAGITEEIDGKQLRQAVSLVQQALPSSFTFRQFDH